MKNGEGKGRTGSTVRCKYGIDTAGKQIPISQLMKKIAPQELSATEAQQGTLEGAHRGDERPYKSAKNGKHSSPGSGADKNATGRAAATTGVGRQKGKIGQLCFLCGQEGHFRPRCNKLSEPDDWVVIDELPERVHEMAA